MATIATWSVDLVAMTSGFSKGLKKANNSTRKFVKQQETMSRKFSNVWAKTGARVAAFGTAAIAGGAAYAATVNKMADSMDKLAKAAKKMKVSPKDLQALQAMAGFAGVEPETATKAMGRMATVAAEASRGQGEAIRTFAELGLDPSVIRGGGLENLQAVLDAAGRMQDAGSRGMAVRKLMGEEGESMVNLIGQDLVSGRNEMDAKGILWQEKNLQNAEDLKDGIGRLTNVVTGKLGNILGENMPQILAAVDQTTETMGAILDSELVRNGGRALSDMALIMAKGAKFASIKGWAGMAKEIASAPWQGLKLGAGQLYASVVQNPQVAMHQMRHDRLGVLQGPDQFGKPRKAASGAGRLDNAVRGMWEQTTAQVGDNYNSFWSSYTEPMDARGIQ